MMRLLSTLGLLAALVPGSPPAGTLTVTVLDPSGAVVPQATVTVCGTTDACTPAIATTSPAGKATFANLAPASYTVRAEFIGFDPGVLLDVRIRPGERKTVTVSLRLQAVQDSVTVSRDAQVVAADPRGSAFSATLTRQEIDALPDDPAELLQQLIDMAGGSATIRVDGFNGGTGGPPIPPKALIKSIRIDRGRFAAEHHSPDFEEIDIVTQPGTGPLRGGGSWRWRDGALSGKSPFTTTKGPERTQAWQMNVGGTLVPSRASFSLSAGVTNAFETPVLNVAQPDGLGTRAQLSDLHRDNDSWTTYDLLDYAMTARQSLRVAYLQTTRTQRNLGVGGYDLPERAYASDLSDHALRLQETGPIGTRLWATTRLGLHWNDTGSHAAVEQPTLRVLDAFTSGGAQMAGGRHAREVEFSTDLDYTRGPHAIRMGVLFEGANFRSDENANYLGTYTFPSLDAFAAGQPASYTRRLGSPHIAYGNVAAGAYLEDDLRVGKGLTFSPGVRYEVQTHVRDAGNLGPRAALTWAPFKSGHTTMRATYGLFYDWLPATTYEQTLRVDGLREQELFISNPTYPAISGNATAIPTNRYTLDSNMQLGTTHRFDATVDQTFTPHLKASLSYYVDRDTHTLRGRNLNAPIDGVRPDPRLANVIEAVSDASFLGRQLQANLTLTPAPRETLRVSYTFSRQENNSDGAFNVPASGSLATEWGPAPFNRRHRVQASFSSQAIKNVNAMVSLAANTGTPYTITTGFDDNGDGIFNDRPADVGRGTRRMPGQFTLSATLSYGIDVGKSRLSWTLNAMNLTNHDNYTGVSGVLTSPFFGQATAVQNPRKVDAGMSVSFK